MTQNSMNTPYAKRVAEKFREAQNYLKTNGFSRSTKHLLEDIENSVENNNANTPYLPQLQYCYDDGFIVIVFGLIGFCLRCILISFFEFRSKIVSLKRLIKH